MTESPRPSQRGQTSEDRARTRLATSFGYQDVRPEDKPAMVGDLFARVADRYDLMNDLMSGGIHRLWKASMVDVLAPRPGMRMVDVAGGTGDIAFRVLDRLKGREGPPASREDPPVSREDPPVSITVADINPAMLAVGRDRAIDRNLLSGIDWIAADAERLPLESASMDAFTIAFGIRNVTHINRALEEARRVLRPGGRFLCLEFSALEWRELQPLYDAYSFTIVPWLGEQIADDREAYQYLVESIRRFPDQKTFAAMIEAAGLSQVRCRNMTGGVAALHSAWRV
ncbi:MAG: class I SAM-dependent methyltransferase [Alphaproteobacteria bacterium]|nr:class I SAM-dependent methyltransferase [Alphaproteobacteria bacterium]